MMNVDDLTEKDFSFVKSLVYRESGIVIGDHKKEMIYRRLSRRVRDLELCNVSRYCELLRKSNCNETINFINAVTTNLTSFFREPHHFDYLSKEFSSNFIKKDKKRLRIWSSACSTGEEPYSIAISLLNAFGSDVRGLDAKILATDLDTEVIKTARRGCYQEDRVKNLPRSMKSNWFDSNRDKGTYDIKQEAKDLVTFNKLNLLGEWPMKGKFDIVFCRNVLIYFDQKTQLKLIERFYDCLEPDGILILGHSESILKGSQVFESLGKTIYQKIAA